MNHNTETIPRRNIYLFILFSVVVVFLFLTNNFIIKSNLRKDQTVSIVSTQTALTALYGKEVESAIKDYWLQLGSVETLKNPHLIYEIASGQLATDLYSASEHVEYDKEPFSIITKSVVISNVLVIEYSTSRFKAIACGKLETEDITPDGIVVNTNIFPNIWVFVFTHQDEKWKAIGYLPTLYPNAYEEAPEWLKQIIGEMPTYYDLKSCNDA